MSRSFAVSTLIVTALVIAGVLGAACGSPTAATSTVPDKPPAEMCPEGQYPILAAYALDDGRLQWVTCDTSSDMHVALAADAGHVWVQIPYPLQTIRIDARTGAVLDTSTEPEPAIPDGADRVRRTPPATATVQLSGGQDDPLIGTEIATGSQRWTAVGFLVYDDVWAADESSVYAILSDRTGAQPGMWLVAYEIDTGEERWRAETTDYSWPWHAAQGLVFSMWYDLHVFDAGDGTERWHTSYGQQAAGFPRMFGAVANDEMVFVSFTSVGSGGD